MLEAGGNAVDAAVASALALAVVFPEAGNLGGGGFAVVRFDGVPYALDFREVAPAGARPDLYLDDKGAPIPGASLYGPLAAGVPGSPMGYWELHHRFGKLPWKTIVAPALALARDGFPISPRTAETIAVKRDLLARFPESAATFLPGGVPLGAGSRLVLPELAQSLERYAAAGPAAFSGGDVARAVEATSRAHGGILTAADLAAYRPLWRQPLRFERFGWSFAVMPLPSSGGVILGETFGILERLGWRDEPRESLARTQLLIEALRRSFADRFPLADPSTSAARPEDLLAPSWIDRRAAEIDRTRATPSPQVHPFPASAAREGTETTNISVVDSDGNAVAMTTTLNSLYGCGLWVPELGFLNDEMDDFTTAPGRANDYGLIQSNANAVRPGNRPLSSMAPTLLWRGNEIVATGGRGGSRIPTAVLQVILDLWDGDSAQAATARRRIHHQWLPDRVEVEPGALSTQVREGLVALGYELVPPPELPKVNLARRSKDGSFEVGGDPRADEAAAIASGPKSPERTP